MTEVIESKYKGNTRKIKIENLKLAYSPLWILSKEEITERMALGIYNRNDIIKRDYSSIAFNNILKESAIDVLDLSKEQIYNYVDSFIQPYLIDNVVLFDGEQ